MRAGCVIQIQTKDLVGHKRDCFYLKCMIEIERWFEFLSVFLYNIRPSQSLLASDAIASHAYWSLGFSCANGVPHGQCAPQSASFESSDKTSARPKQLLKVLFLGFSKSCRDNSEIDTKNYRLAIPTKIDL